MIRGGSYCIHPAFGPIVEIEAGEVGEYPIDFCFDMVNAGAAEYVDEPRNILEPKSDEKSDSIEEFLNNLVSEFSDDEGKAKSALEDYGKKELGIDIDKRKGIKKIIVQLMVEHAEQNKND